MVETMRGSFFCRIIHRGKDFSKWVDLVEKITAFCWITSTHTAPESDADIVDVRFRFCPLEIPFEIQLNDLPSHATLCHVSHEDMWDDTPGTSLMIIWYLSLVRGRGKVLSSPGCGIFLSARALGSLVGSA